MPDLVISQLTISTIVVVVMEHLKRATWFPWLKAEGDKMNRAIAALMAAITAVGIHYTYDASAAGGTLVFTGISWAALGHGVWHWLQSYATQEVIYKGAIRQSNPVAPKSS